ncbi:MAG: CCA tRNA nucleotidyltransferase [Pirellulales bacterium]
MSLVSPSEHRKFALDVLETLRRRGFEAYWAGGCVRDKWLGREPKDYDVATNATPEQVRAVFGRRRTLAIGVAFGVIVVLGPKAAGQIEVTTFRCDAVYSDGRHPDAVVYSTAEMDARRRDFTINGLFYDPVAEQVIDFVGGVEDLNRRVVRAIGEPRERFAEDKLRMLRAVRFTATLDFALDESTGAAVREMAREIHAVSPERIAQEIRLMLVDSHRAGAMDLLRQTGLLEPVLPEVAAGPPEAWEHALRVLDRLREPSFPLALAALLQAFAESCPAPRRNLVEVVADRWRLSNKESDRASWLVEHRAALRDASQIPWPRLQPLLVSEGIEDLLALGEAIALAGAGEMADVEYCRRRLELPGEKLNPPPLLTGDDLVAHGIPPGKVFKGLLQTVRDAQLEETIGTREEALTLVNRLLKESRDGEP